MWRSCADALAPIPEQGGDYLNRRVKSRHGMGDRAKSPLPKVKSPTLSEQREKNGALEYFLLSIIAEATLVVNFAGAT